MLGVPMMREDEPVGILRAYLRGTIIRKVVICHISVIVMFLTVHAGNAGIHQRVVCHNTLYMDHSFAHNCQIELQ